jgi:hypothetical protein
VINFSHVSVSFRLSYFHNTSKCCSLIAVAADVEIAIVDDPSKSIKSKVCTYYYTVLLLTSTTTITNMWLLCIM